MQQEPRQVLIVEHDPRLADLTRDHLASDDLKVVPLTELLRAETLDRLLLQVYGAELMPAKLPVLVSQWFKYYAMHLIPPVVVASLVHRACWSLRLDQVGFALHEQGFLDRVRFGGEAFPASDSSDPFERFAPLLDNLQQVIERLSVYGSVTAGVLWSTAGDYLETCLRQIAEIDHDASEIGYGLLRQRWCKDGRRNPLFNAISYKNGPDGQAVRQRRNCCLSHRVEWVGRCEHCPWEKDAGSGG